MKKTTTAKTPAKSRTPATAATAAAPAPAPKFTGEPRVKAAPTTVSKARNDDIVIVAAPPAATVITAQIDVGFGNTLFIRGDGPGLSWEKGVPLGCTAVDRWTISLLVTTRPVVFKFLLNDKLWSLGEDYVVKPGGNATFTPKF
jgi:hypothetical protein